MKPVKKSLKAITFSVLLLPLLGMHATAAVVVNNGDVSGGNYTYSVFYGDLTPGNSKIVTDPSPGSTSTNFALVQEGGGAGTRYLVAQSFGPNSIQYQFDFSSSDYRIKDVAVTDRLTLFATADQTGTILSEYSADGSTWTTLRTISPALSTTGDSFGTVNFTLGDSATLYYRATASITAGEPFFTTSFQWNRIDNVGLDNTLGFNVAFTNLTVVPEPSSAAMLLIAVGGLAFIRRKRS